MQIVLVRPGLLESPRVNRGGRGGGAAPEQIGRGQPGAQRGEEKWKCPLFRECLPFSRAIAGTMLGPLLDFNWKIYTSPGFSHLRQLSGMFVQLLQLLQLFSPPPPSPDTAAPG